MNATQNRNLFNRISVSIITGFLGCGKTTLLNHLVRHPGMDSVALIINEFGEIGLDNLLVETSIENTLLLENGCICCSVRGDLIDTVVDLLAKARNGTISKFSRILIETTGLADPGPIINTLQNQRVMAENCRLDSVVTLIDGVQGKSQAFAYPEAMKQIAQADVGLITKRDLIGDEKAAGLKAFAERINPALEVAAIENGYVAPGFLFGRDDTRSIAELSIGTADSLHRGHQHGHDTAVEHRHGNISTWSFVDEAPLDRDRLYAWLRMVYSLRASYMLRLKGLIRLDGYDCPLLLQGVGPVLSRPQFMPEWPKGKEVTRLVFIVKGLPKDKLSASFLRHVASLDCR